MKAEQYERYVDFATRMIDHAWPGMTDRRKQRLKDEVLPFLENWVKDSAVRTWDQEQGADGMYLCDAFSEAFIQYWQPEPKRDRSRPTFYDQIACVLRAGIDLVGDGGCGVLGFAVGDLRRMYDGNLPEWIASLYHPPLDATVGEKELVWL